MPVHVPKRVYTASALEEWFGVLSKDWERHFTDEELALGQTAYESGHVSSIELQNRSAIVHGRVNEKDLYALIEWESEPPGVRSSSVEKLSGRILAVAGLYEAEELVVESISPLPPEPIDEQKAKKPSGGLFADDRKKGSVSLGPSRPLLHPIPRAIPSRVESPQRPGVAQVLVPQARGVLVKFSATSEALVFDAYWQRGDGELEAAMKSYRTKAPQVTETERERLIRLTALARKSGFELEGGRYDYQLKDFSKITEVLRSDLEIWKKYFTLEIPDEVHALSKGVQTITVEVEACGEAEALSFRWLFLLGGKELSREEVLSVLKNPREAVLLPQRGLLKLSDEQADVVSDWAGTILQGGGKLPRYMLFSLFRQDALPIRLNASLEQWSRSILEPSDHAYGSPGFLREYQRKGVAWLGHMLEHDCHPLLADEMGLGKTVQMLTLLTQRPDARVLVVTPASVIPVWANEISKHFPKNAFHIVSQEHLPSADSNGLWLASYGQLKRHAEALTTLDFDTAVLDEAQMIKNPRTKAAQACFALRARRRLAMTGTPVENRALDLWSIFRFLMPGLLGGMQRFENLSETNGSKLVERLRQQVSPFILRRTKAEVARDLPEKIEEVLSADLEPMQRLHYGRLVEQGLKRFGNDLRKASRSSGLAFFTLLTRLRQASCDAGLLPWVNCGLENSGKIKVMLERLEGILASGSKVVIFSQFVTFLGRIRSALAERFPQVSTFELTGSTSDRQKPVSDFQNAEGAAVILVSLRAGGTGITLHAADYLFLMDPWWNPAVEDQAIDRVHRLGQKKTVFVYRVVSAGTVEERIQALKLQKREIFANLVGNLRDNTHFALYFKSMSELIALAPPEEEEVD